MIYTKCIFEVYTVYTADSRTPKSVFFIRICIFCISTCFSVFLPCILHFLAVYQRIQRVYHCIPAAFSMLSTFQNLEFQFPAPVPPLTCSSTVLDSIESVELGL
ncbi:hypothetical protein R3W88_032332 [Solanum pinnatisectum]|uniref:Uncharacterized protein n=1 Tax=Solanum pinnatisectum TaxID=50273 RepID=A0AAV9LSF9_9SOLN|nr:hypothetical protein R3W88_032332 [Solanum pinnatisectum]